MPHILMSPAAKQLWDVEIETFVVMCIILCSDGRMDGRMYRRIMLVVKSWSQLKKTQGIRKSFAHLMSPAAKQLWDGEICRKWTFVVMCNILCSNSIKLQYPDITLVTYTWTSKCSSTTSLDSLFWIKNIRKYRKQSIFWIMFLLWELITAIKLETFDNLL